MKPHLAKLLAVTVVIVAIILFFLKPGDRDPAEAVAERKQVDNRRTTSGSADPDAGPPGRRKPRPERAESGNKEIGAADLEKWLAGLQGNARTIAEAHATVGLLNQDPELIRKALEMDPNNPLLLYIGSAHGYFPEEERLALAGRFLNQDPDNAMAAYLYAARLLKSGDVEKGIEILGSAAERQRMDDYNAKLGIMFEEAFAGAGSSRDMAKLQSIANLTMPSISALLPMADSLNEMAKASTPSEAAAINALSAAMGKRYGEQAGSGTFINHIAGLALEQKTLAGLPDDAPSPYEGLSVAEARESIAVERENLRESMKSLPDVESLLPGNAELTHGYVDRFRMFGEAEAVKWLAEQTGGAEK